MTGDQPDEAGQPAPESPQPAPAEELELVKARLKAVIKENNQIAEEVGRLQEEKTAQDARIRELEGRIIRQREIAITEIVLNKRLAAELAKAKAARPGPAPPARQPGRWTHG